MAEGIIIYGRNHNKRRYTNNLQDFAKKVLATDKSRNSVYDFGDAGNKIILALRKLGVELNTTKVGITDKTIRKYKDHPKREKGATISPRRYVMVEHAVKHPKNVYLDKDRGRIIIVAATRYKNGKVLKVVIDPNQRLRKKDFHLIRSIGVVSASDMTDENIFQKLI